jgi:hypothetical protein
MKFQCTLLTFGFAFGTFKNDSKISVLFVEIQNLKVSNLAIAKVQKVNIAVTYLILTNVLIYYHVDSVGTNTLYLLNVWDACTAYFCGIRLVALLSEWEWVPIHSLLMLMDNL